jgi:hypothetical protein
LNIFIKTICDLALLILLHATFVKASLKGTLLIPSVPILILFCKKNNKNKFNVHNDSLLFSTTFLSLMRLSWLSFKNEPM